MMAAPSRTGNARRPRMEVTKSDQRLSGSREKVRPGARMFRIVVMKFKEPIRPDIMKKAKAISRSV